MGYYIHTVIVFVIGNTIRKAVVTVMIGNYIHRVIVIEGSLFSREYGNLPHVISADAQVDKCVCPAAEISAYMTKSFHTYCIRRVQC